MHCISSHAVECWIYDIAINFCGCDRPLYVTCIGVPQERRGEIWLLLVEQHQLRHNASELSVSDAEGSEKYEDLLKRLTLHQHSILIDLGMCKVLRVLTFYFVSVSQATKTADLQLWDCNQHSSVLVPSLSQLGGLSGRASVVKLGVETGVSSPTLSWIKRHKMSLLVCVI